MADESTAGALSPSPPVTVAQATGAAPPLAAAGILFVAKDDGRVLLMRRIGRDHAGEWAFPGGGLEGDETAEAAARREAYEETAFDYRGPLAELARRVKDGVDFTTFVAEVPKFEPTLNPEHDAALWVERERALAELPLHPGARVALVRPDMNELDVARAIRDGELTSPQRYERFLLVALRITGTGLAYRPALKEVVWRDPSLYLTEDFLARCNGLVVVLNHQSGGTLGSREFKARAVGTIFLPYLSGEEAWGIAKVYDAEAIRLIERDPDVSTSPYVLTGGARHRLGDGRHLLIEETPELIDSLAITTTPGGGVWDKGETPHGVESVTAEDAGPDLEGKLARIMAQVQGAKLDAILREVRGAHAA